MAKVTRQFEITERANGLIEVLHNPSGIIGTGEQEMQEIKPADAITIRRSQ